MVIAELAPREHFAKFLVSAVTTGQGDETVGKFSDKRLAFVHVFYDAQVRQAFMYDFLDDELFWNHTDDVPAIFKRGVGNDAHKPDATAAIDQFQSPLREKAAKMFSGLGVSWTNALV